MEFELMEKEPEITFNPAQITFPAFEDYMQAAGEVAAFITAIDVSEDTIQSAKKALAAARKIVDKLETQRKAVKREVMKPYDTFADQVAEISGVINGANRALAEKVRTLDQMERDAKEEELRKIWNKRINQYSISDFYPDSFKLWITPQHLNKSMSMKAAEQDMIDWLEKTETDYQAARSLGEEVETEYIQCLNLTEAISAVKAREQIREQIQEAREEEEPAEDKWSFIVIGEKDAKLTEMLLNVNNIEFIKRRI